MSTIIDTVTEYEAKALELIVKVQDDVLTYVKQAVAYVEGVLPTVTLPEIELLDQVPTLAEVVDTQFAFSKKVLASQEKFAKNVVKTVKPLTREGLAAKAAKAAPKAAAEAA